MTVRLSAILLTFNSAPFIRRCLESMYLQELPGMEVIIMDNASEDATREILRGLPWEFKLMESEENLGFARGCNVAWQASEGELLIFVNPDVVLGKDCLQQLVAPFEADERVAICGAKIYYPNTTIIQHAGGIIHPNGMTDHRGRDEPDKGQYDRKAEVDYVTGAVVAVRRSFMEEVGGFDVDYSPAYFEEADLCWRARKAGWGVWYVPEAIAYHYESPGLQKFSPRYYRQYLRNRMRFLIKNYGLREWIVKFLPFELRWLTREKWAWQIKGHILRSYGAGLGFLLQRLTGRRERV